MLRIIVTFTSLNFTFILKCLNLYIISKGMVKLIEQRIKTLKAELSNLARNT